MIENISFEALTPGKTLLFLGAVHGNEPCGPIAIRDAAEKFRSGEWSLKQGRVMFVPVCNPRAFAQNVRQIDRNLNRHFYPKDRKVAYEDHLDPILCKVIDQADLVIDLHSYTVGKDPYALIEAPEKDEIDLAASTGITTILYGWAEAYAAAGMASDPKESQGLVNYARLTGTPAITLECGQHDDPASVDVARAAIENVLATYGFLDGRKPAQKVEIYGMRQSVFKRRAGDFVRPFANLEPIAKGDLIARYDDGEEVRAQHDGVILLTKPWAQPGGEWFNTAVIENV